MENKSLDVQKKLAAEAHRHSDKMLELTEKAAAPLRESSGAETSSEQLEPIILARRVAMQATAESHKVIALQSELMNGQRRDMAETLENSGSKPDED